MLQLRIPTALLLLSVAIATPAIGQTPLNDTGRITCHNNSSTIAGTVSDATPNPEPAGFEEQDCTRGAAAADARGRMPKVGASSAPGRDYTKIANDGSVLPASAVLGPGPRDWACTRDNVTGLVWEVKTTSGLRNMAHRYTWYDTDPAINGGVPGEIGTSTTCDGTLPNCNTTAYRDAINALAGAQRLCGASDWRLPTVFELVGLAHYGAFDPAIDRDWFPNTGESAPTQTNGIVFHWTRSGSAGRRGFEGQTDAAYGVNFSDATVFPTLKSGTHYVRLVRGGP